MASTINPEYSSTAAAGTLSVEPEKAIIIDVQGRSTNKVAVVEVVLRVLLFATSLTSVVSIATSKQTKRIPVPFPPYGLSMAAELTDSPAFIYLVAALSVACLYSIITTLLSFFALIKRSVATSRSLTSHFVMIDVLLLGIVASAAGAAGEVAYIGLKGNSNVGWQKICNIYDSYCRHVGFSVLCSIFSALALAFLIMLSTITISRKNSK